MSDILGTYDLEKKIEDVIILLENTRANYGNPDLVVEIEAALLGMINTKMAIEPNSRFALVTFSDEANIELELKDFSPDAFNEALYEIELSENDVANIDVGMTAAFEVTVKSMQQLAEGKRFRMMVLSAGDVQFGENKKWEELTNVCEKVGVFVDTVQIAKPFAPKDEILERIAKRTESFFYFCDDISMLESMLSNLIPAKVEVGADKFQSREDRDMRGLLEYIAADLQSLDKGIKTVEDLKKIVTQEDDSMKCGICHSPDCMFCKGPAFSCGAFCPECGRFFHQHCCAGWAESQKDTPKTVFKCPVCFHLLKVPGELHRIQVLKTSLQDNEPVLEAYNIKKMNINELGIKGAFQYCSWCKNVFEPNEEIYRCENCGAFYHIDCAEEMMDKTKNRCRLCDAPIGLSVRKGSGIERIV